MARMFERQDRPSFHIKPRYWDPEKEEREEREKRIKTELGIAEEDNETYIPNLRGRLTNMYQERKSGRKGYNGRYAVRLFLVLIIVFLIVFYLIARYSEGGLKFFGI